VSKLFQLDEHGWGWGSLNAFRLANKRFKQVVESCTTMLTHRQDEDGPYSIPALIVQKCRRIERILCLSHNLRSLEGCPDGLKLWIGRAPHLSDLSPLASCSMMDYLWIEDSTITDISVTSSMPLLKTFACQKRVADRPSIKDLSPLVSCTRLRRLYLYGNGELKDISPLKDRLTLETLSIAVCPLIASLAPLSNLINLKEVNCAGCSLISSLSPLSHLKNLKKLDCRGMDPQTSLLPLAWDTVLEELKCMPDAVDLEELMRRMLHLVIRLHGQQ
jgi:hypothetical protein